MTEDLYQDPINFLPQPENIVVDNPQVSSLLGLTLPQIISYINVFTLAWCVFYSIYFITDFYFYLIKYPDREVARMQKGAESFRRAVQIWASYMVCWVFLLLYVVFRNTIAGGFLGVIAVAVYLIKIFYYDLKKIYYFEEGVTKLYKSLGDGFSGLLKSITTPAKSDDKK